MPTVLHVTQPTDAGVAAYVADLCADQLDRGWDVYVARPDQGQLPGALTALGVRQIRWEADRAIGIGIASETVRLNRLLDRVGPDLLHLHSSKAGLAGRLAARGRLPTLFQPHGWSWLAAPRRLVGAIVAWERFAARWTTLYVCVGEGEAEQGRLHGLRGRYCVVRNGVDLTRFERADEDERRAARARLNLPVDAPHVVCVGRVTRQKGQDVLVAAWEAVRAQCPKAILAIVGSGELLESLRVAASAGVIFVGQVDDPRPWYAAADLVVLPSRWEGLPLTLLEALAVGRSVVGSDIPGISEALPEGAGTLVRADDAGALAEAIVYRIGRVEVTTAEGAAAARYAAEHADIRRTYDTLATLTVGLAGSRR
jgi:glycosyltransferase involved in cell wall biosynthesis